MNIHVIIETPMSVCADLLIIIEIEKREWICDIFGTRHYERNYYNILYNKVYV